MNQGPGNTQAEQKPVAVLKERMGGLSDKTKQFVKEQNQVKKAIRATLKAGPATVPDIARKNGLDTAKVMWQLMAMKRYGEIVEGATKGDYYTYRLKEVT